MSLIKGILFVSVSGHSSRVVGLAEGDVDGTNVGSKLGLSEGIPEMDGLADGEEDDVGVKEGTSELIGVGMDDGFLEGLSVGDIDGAGVAGESFVDNPPSVGIGWILTPEVGPEGRNDGRSIGPVPEEVPPVLSYMP